MAYKLLTSDQRLEICRLLGEFKSYADIQRHFREKYGRDLHNKVIENYSSRPEWKTLVTKFRTQYVTGMMDIAISHKRHRLQKLDTLVRGIENNDGRFKFSSDEAKFDRLIVALEKARLETEPTKSGDIHFYATQFNSLTDEEIKERKSALMEKVLKLQKMMEESNATHSQGGENPPLDEQAVRSEEGKTGLLRLPEQRDDNGDTQEVKPNETL